MTKEFTVVLMMQGKYSDIIINTTIKPIAISRHHKGRGVDVRM